MYFHDIIYFLIWDYWFGHTWSKNIFWIATSGAAAAAVNPDGIRTLLANGLSTFFIKGKPDFSNNPESLPKYSPDFPILCNRVFDNFILADKPFAEALRNLEICVLVNDNSCERLVSSLESPTTFDESYFSIIFYSRF